MPFVLGGVHGLQPPWRAPGAAPAEAVVNPESNQPPVFYLLMGLALRPWRAASPETMLLAVRLVNVLLVAVALVGPLRLLAKRRPPIFTAVGLLALLLPGAAESLARASNDASVFLWSALVLAALDRGRRGAGLTALLGLGPLLKLTAIPIVVFGVAVLWREGRARQAGRGAAAASLVFLVQWARGWNWGGTMELNRAAPAIGEPVGAAALGLVRTLFTFLKTTFWLGGWSFFRAPFPLVLSFAAVVGGWILAAKARPDPRRVLPHLAAAAAAVAGFFVFALANRRLYGVWGGVGGWYAWAWWPWIAVAACDLGTIPPRAARALTAATGLFVVAANAVWVRAATQVYGSLAG